MSLKGGFDIMIEYLNSIIPYFYIGLGTRPIDTFGMIALVLSVPLGAFLWPLRYGMLEDRLHGLIVAFE